MTGESDALRELPQEARHRLRGHSRDAHPRQEEGRSSLLKKDAFLRARRVGFH